MTIKWVYNPMEDTLDATNKGFTDGANTNYTGVDCTGGDGVLNRTLSTNGVKLVVVDNQFLHPTVDYTTSGNTITFLNQIFNTQNITIWN